MRRALLKQLPHLTRFYGIKPRDIDEMTLREVQEYVLAFEKYIADHPEE